MMCVNDPALSLRYNLHLLNVIPMPLALEPVGRGLFVTLGK